MIKPTHCQLHLNKIIYFWESTQSIWYEVVIIIQLQFVRPYPSNKPGRNS